MIGLYHTWWIPVCRQAGFVTIYTKNREYCFGEVIDGKITLNELGRYTTEHRKHISDHYPFVVCDEFICMPNHIHGILIIGDNQSNRDVGTQFFASSLGGSNQKKTYKNMSLPDGIQPKSGSLGFIVRGFKIGITKFAKQHDIPFARQSRLPRNM